jgi:hypothetical protein
VEPTIAIIQQARASLVDGKTPIDSVFAEAGRILSEANNDIGIAVEAASAEHLAAKKRLMYESKNEFQHGYNDKAEQNALKSLRVLQYIQAKEEWKRNMSGPAPQWTAI